MKARNVILASALIVFICAFLYRSHSAPRVIPLSILKTVSDFNAIPSHQGMKTSRFYKNGKAYAARTDIKYLDTTHFLFKTHEPKKYEGNVIAADGEYFLMYMPKFRARLKTKLRLDIRLEKGIETLHFNVDLSSLSKNYVVTYAGTARVSGVAAHVLHIKGKRLPFVQKVWISKQKPLVIKGEKYYKGSKYYSFSYDAFSFLPPSAEALALKIPLAAFPLPSKNELAFYDSLQSARLSVKNSPIPVLGKTPGGFLFSHVEVMKSPLGEVVSSLYSDGVTGVRAGKRKEGGVFDGMLKLFGLNMDEIQNDIKNYSPMNFYEIKKGNEFFALSGELPENELKKYMPYFSELK